MRILLSCCWIFLINGGKKISYHFFQNVFQGENKRDVFSKTSLDILLVKFSHEKEKIKRNGEFFVATVLKKKW